MKILPVPIIIAAAASVLALGGCGTATEMTEEEIKEYASNVYDENHTLNIIREINSPDGYKKLYLAEDSETHIVYYFSGEKYKKGRSMSPYYSENGRLCKYVNNEIIEIKGE